MKNKTKKDKAKHKLKYFPDLGYANASFLENLAISEWFRSLLGPSRRDFPSRHGVKDDGSRR
jgi:hypothetical protein